MMPVKADRERGETDNGAPKCTVEQGTPRCGAATDREWDGSPDEEYRETDRGNSFCVFFSLAQSDSFT